MVRGAQTRRGTPTGRRIVTVLQLGFMVWAAVALAHGRVADALALGVMFVVLQAPRLLRVPLVFDVAFLLAWTLQALGQVAGFWSRVPWWDTLVHGALPAVLAPTGLIVLIRVGVLPDVLEPGGAGGAPLSGSGVRRRWTGLDSSQSRPSMRASMRYALGRWMSKSIASAR